jgi:hypothetical protein
MAEQTYSFEREQALARHAAMLPASTYNLSRILLANSRHGCVFVPLRNLQYLAVIDAEEIIFVDSQYRRWVEITWQAFRPGERKALDEPVAYEAALYTTDAAATQRRLLSEFHPGLARLEQRRRPSQAADILHWPSR